MSLASKSSHTEGIVLKRVSVGEADRVVTLFTPDVGKLVCVAKGVRKLTSTQRATLEPGNHISVLLINTSSLPLLTQSRLVNDFAQTKRSLRSMKQLAQVLEIVDRMFPEGVAEVELFAQVLEILELLNSPSATHSANKAFTQIQAHLSDLVAQLGYPEIAETTYTSLTDYVSAMAEKPMHSYDFLTVRK